MHGDRTIHIISGSACPGIRPSAAALQRFAQQYPVWDVGMVKSRHQSIQHIVLPSEIHTNAVASLRVNWTRTLCDAAIHALHVSIFLTISSSFATRIPIHEGVFPAELCRKQSQSHREQAHVQVSTLHCDVEYHPSDIDRLATGHRNIGVQWQSVLKLPTHIESFDEPSVSAMSLRMGELHAGRPVQVSPKSTEAFPSVRLSLQDAESDPEGRYQQSEFMIFSNSLS
jgi:hypothetical protein